ncbi:MAG: hypothetical protein Q8T03_02770 [Bacteroidota bacterium]|nr:hypothetical protein [Bacteroidota bacterium]
MSFDGKEGEFISLTQGATLTANYRSGQSNPILGHFLGVEKLRALLSQEGCVGLRIYHGLDSDTGYPAVVVVGADSSENDILGSSPLILDMSILCPPTCGNSNDLNS